MDRKNRKLTEEVIHILRLSPFYDSIPNKERSEFIYEIVDKYQHLFVKGKQKGAREVWSHIEQ